MRIKVENTRTDEMAYLEGPFLPEDAVINVGDEFTIGGVHTAVPNLARRWWQFWKPKYILGPLQKYRVLEVTDGQKIKRTARSGFGAEGS